MKDTKGFFYGTKTFSLHALYRRVPGITMILTRSVLPSGTMSTAPWTVRECPFPSCDTTKVPGGCTPAGEKAPDAAARRLSRGAHKCRVPSHCLLQASQHDPCSKQAAY
ncbi:hypothetical protein ACQJBY_004282 [Aegilops geniculata]